LAAGDSSTKFGENLKVLPGRRESRGSGGAETVCGPHLLVHEKLVDILLLEEGQTSN